MVPFLASLPLFGPVLSPTGSPVPAGQPARTFRFVYSAAVGAVPAGARQVDVWLPLPSADANQTIQSLRVEAPGPVAIRPDPVWRNRILHLRLPPPAKPAFRVTVEVVATRRENAGRAEPLSPAQRQRYLAPDRLVPRDGRIAAVSREITGERSSVRERAQAIYEYVTATLRYDKSGTGWGRGDALFACDARRGNCTDFHSLIIGLARAAGIPARFSIGFALPAARGAGEIPGYHCWAELYVDGAWLPVDSSEAAKNPTKTDYFFGHHDENRIQFSTGRDLRLQPAPAQGPINFLIYPVVEIDGKTHSAVESTFRFADLPEARQSRGGFPRSRVGEPDLGRWAAASAIDRAGPRPRQGTTANPCSAKWRSNVKARSIPSRRIVSKLAQSTRLSWRRFAVRSAARAAACVSASIQTIRTVGRIPSASAWTADNPILA